MRNLDKLTIAAVNGVAIQTGLSLALACDFRIASTEAMLGSATLRFGFLPDEGGQFLLVQLIGVAKTMDFLMRKRIVSAAEALELGLVHEVVPPSELMLRAMDLARELAEGPQVAMRMLKRSIYNAAEMTFAQALDEIAAKTAVSDHHPDAAEGVKAFQEKRAPRFNRWIEERKIGRSQIAALEEVRDVPFAVEPWQFLDRGLSLDQQHQLRSGPRMLEPGATSSPRPTRPSIA